MAAPTPSKPKPLILLAEDDEMVSRLVQRVLSEVGEVIAFSDGQQLFDYLHGPDKPRPALIVTDVMMPKLDGPGLVAKLKAEPILGAIPVIMLTAKSSPKDIIAGINTGVRHYVTKPFQQADFLSKVRKVLG